jgi:hypothetical protein
MNNSHGRGPGPRQPWPRRMRAAAVITATAASAVLAAACSGSPPSTGSGGSSNAGGSAHSSSAVAYSRCVRAHGVPNFPDPDSNGKIPPAAKRALREVSNSLARAATYACRNLNPTEQGSPTLTAQQQQDYLRAAACMRSHGIANFPDPSFSGGDVHFPIPSGIDPSSAQFTRARQTCQRLIPAGLPYSGSDGGS